MPVGHEELTGRSETLRNSEIRRLRVVPHLSSGIVERAKRLFCVGWFARALAFLSLYYPWGQFFFLSRLQPVRINLFQWWNSEGLIYVIFDVFYRTSVINCNMISSCSWWGCKRCSFKWSILLHFKNLKIKIVINMISVITIIDKSRDLFYSIYGFR